MTPDRRRPPDRRFWQTTLFAATVIGLLLLMYHLSMIFVPLLIAFLLTYIWNPVVTRLERHMPRLAAIGVIYLGFLTAIGLMVLYGVPALVNQGATFVEEGFIGEKLTVDANVNGLLDPGDEYEDANKNGKFDAPKFHNLVAWVERAVQKWMGDSDWKDLVRRFREKARGNEKDVFPALGQVAKSLFSGALSGIQGILTVLSFCVLVPVYLFFLLKNMNLWWEKFQILIPAPYKDKALRVLRRIHASIASFYRGQIMISLIEGTLLFVVLAALGVKLAFLFGVLYTVLSLIPYVGVISTFALTSLFVVADTGEFGTKFMMVGGLFLFIQLLESLVLQPLILGRETGLHPMLIIIAILVFGNLFGFLGILLAVPLASACIILGQEYLLPALHQSPEVTADTQVGPLIR